MDWMQQAAQAAAGDAPQVLRPPPAVVPGRVLHLDGDLLAYSCGGSEDTTVGESRLRAIEKITSLRDQCGSESVVLHLTTSGSTKADRFIIATVKAYQGQRKSGRKPKNWGYLREFLEGYEGPLFRPKLWSTREADDGVALCAYDSLAKGKGPIAIASGDKDFRMLPGVHINWNTYHLTEVPHMAYDVAGLDGLQYGTKWFFLQMLQGDTADNIPGLPKFMGKPVGEVTARNILDGIDNHTEAWQTVAGCYDEHYGSEANDRLVEQAMLLWLRTDHGAFVGDFAKVLGVGGLSPNIERVQQRIKEAYEQAQKYASQASS